MTVPALVGQLALVETRAEGAHALARTLGAEDLMLFLLDPELGVFLPAPGFPQTIKGGAEWRAFVADIVAKGRSTGRMPGPTEGDGRAAWGFSVEPNAVLIVVGGSPDMTAIDEALPLIPLVATLGANESAMRSLQARAAMSDNAVLKGAALAHALERSRDRLRDALAEAGAARRAVEEQARLLSASREEVEQAGEELEVINEELRATNDELIASAEDADRARASAEEANRSKSEFLAMMSHELRTPLNAIGGYASLLEEGIMGPLVPGQREYVARIKRSQSHLAALINDVLNFAKAESGTITYNIEPLQLTQVLDGVAPLIEPMARTKGVAYEYVAPADDVEVLGDRDKMVQVVLNLLTNAVKFTPEHGRVGLTVDLTGALVRLVVSDSGPGIPADQCASIFEPFVQLERSFAREREGVGLGLSISRELARGMSGDVTVESTLGTGSCFIFTLRRADRTADAGTDGRARAARERSRT